MSFKPEWIVLHCSASPGSTLESIRRWHVEGRGWDDVGYHFVIEESGALRIGRPLSMPGAHAKGANDKSIGVCLSGNGDVYPFQLAQVATLKKLCEALMLTYGIPSERVIGHREVHGKIPGAAPTSKTCPGKHAELDRWRRVLGFDPALV